MGLVNELQESAERDDVLTVLRRAKRVSAKLGLQDISHWLDHEQNGYPNGEKLPSYRNVRVSFCYNTNGYIPAGYGMMKSGIVPLDGFNVGVTMPIKESVSTIAAWIVDMTSHKHGLYQTLPPDVETYIRSQMRCNWPEILDQLTFMARLDESQIRDIPEQVKNRILDWACALESKGVTGDSQSFSDNEKQSAQTVIFNISNSSIDQLNNSGDNIKGT